MNCAISGSLQKKPTSSRVSPSRRWQSGKNSDRVNKALIQHAENDVDRDQSGQNQWRLIRQRISERRGGSLEIGLQAGGGKHLPCPFIPFGECISTLPLPRALQIKLTPPHPSPPLSPPPPP